MTTSQLQALKAAAAACFDVAVFATEQNGDWYVTVGSSTALPRSRYHDALQDLAVAESWRHAHWG